MWIATTYKAGTSYGSTGKIYRCRPEADVTPQFVEITPPSDVTITDTRPSSVTYRNRWYATGLATDNLMVDEFSRCHRQGIRPPKEVPVIAAGAGTGLTGTMIGYISFYDEFTQERSSLSGASASIDVTNKNITWTNLPTTSPDSRVTHLEFWRSVDGGLTRLVTRRQLGVTTLTENVATLALGEAFGTSFERLPRGTCNAVYHERQFIAGNATAPDTLYASALLYPERWEGLTFRTRNGDPIVALAPVRDVLLVFTPHSTYILRGWTEDDMTMVLHDAEIGCIAHAGIQVIHDQAWVPSDKGIFLWNGAYHELTADVSTLWVDMYYQYTSIFENCFSVHDPNARVYMLFTAGSSFLTARADGYPEFPDPDEVRFKTICWVANYEDVTPQLSGVLGQPRWSFDLQFRIIAGAAIMYIPTRRRGDVYLGCDDGHIRTWTTDNGTDDSDTYDKRLWIRTGHILGVGGDKDTGHELKTFWSHVFAEDTAWTLYCRGGEDDVWLGVLPDNTSYHWKNDVAVSQSSASIGGFTVYYLPKTVHYHEPSRVVGKGFTFEWTCVNPNPTLWGSIQPHNRHGFCFRGYGGTYGPGRSSRGVAESVQEV